MGKELRNAIKRIAVLVMAFVLVSAAVSPALAAPVKKAPSLNANEVTIVVGKSFNFNIDNKIKGSTYKWRTTNKDVAVVNEKNGVVTGVGKGTTNVFCQIKVEGKSYLLRAKIHVLKPAVSLTIANPVEALDVGKYYRLKTEIIPKTSNDIVTWSSSDDSIVKVDSDGSFAAKKPGTVTITATTVSGRKDSVTIKILGDVSETDDGDKPDDVVEDTDEKPEEEIDLGDIVYEENFETSIGAFVSRGSAKIGRTTAGKAAEGKGYMAITGRTANWNGAMVNVTDKVVPGATYHVTGWVRYTSGDDYETLKITQQADTRNGEEYIDITGEVEVKKGEWTQVSGVMVVPPSATKSQVYFEALSLIDFYADHLVIREVVADIIEEDLSGIKPAEVGDIVYRNDFEGDKVLDARGSSQRTITTKEAYKGKSSLEVTRTAGWDGAGVRFVSANDIEILSLYGRTVEASFYVKYTEGPDEVQFKLNNKMEKAEDSDNILSQIAVKKGEWTLINAECYIAEKTAGNLIFVETEGDVALTFYIDDVEIKVVK
ncbi:MAG: hypothetical protein GX379_10285 [Clostridiales bacterium]|jgi:hypothetical protein|nr:hypothetical protein [Clostridiales bacterium]